MNELRIGAFSPTPGRHINIIWKGSNCYRDADILRSEKRQLGPVFPVETRRRDAGLRQPVKSNVVEDVVFRQAFGLTVKYARHHCETPWIVVEYPGSQSNRRIRYTVKRLRAVPHLLCVTETVLVEKDETIVRVHLVGCE